MLTGHQLRIFAKAIVNGEVTADNAEAKTLDFYNQINTSIVK